ncbi:acyl-CoA carboxylase subunit beta [Corynebacterium flavescens]|uniref:Methylmalonyl-CoA carboxyltransferase n=1 Tax=Corynebacterium flavescens TaxID=28028 RepID=A0A1L7CKF8_CORFL|nr:acyl-CoA carboxylase subunit beta [Corynebacterium flavescens]APT86253.1 methylmalonyl-CoA carboxyltransferase [Corynebacterium flavescens]KAA8724516.1 acyl-CoA carboxylase subunit beta [Corynebacterium flavescens]MDN6099117.1 acyl-CoA carboxylase subunit beta [Corynebacterium flavescens]MDN6200247.1 acyl-CoA carboxylase subunit beta [Corynebacterium flavescens]MDN6226465.1 acyl-CoA carboxylase subunit beta [Corynebacterium flavescens]
MTISSHLAELDSLNNANTTAEKIAELKRRRAAAEKPMGDKAIDKVHAQDRLTARDRLDYLLDEGSFVETDMLATHRTTDFGMSKKKIPTDGIVTGWGTIDGREVCIFSQDGTVFGGALGEVYGEKMVKIMELAVTTGRPLIGLYEGAGARIQDGAVSLDWIAQTFYQNIKASGVVPQISVIMGACAGGNAYSPALTDFVVMVDKKSKMFVTGPDVIKTVTGEEITQEELGGAAAHMLAAGNSHYTAASDEEALDWVHDLVGYLPSNNRQRAPFEAFEELGDEAASDLSLDEIIPDSPTQPYNVKEVIEALTDDGEFLEIQSERAENVVVAFGRIEGQSVGFVANQPQVYAGCLDIDSSEKAARFIRTCDAFNIPIVLLVDVPGFLPGASQEHSGILRRGAKLLYAYGEATVPKITVTMRKAYGGAYCVMGSKGLGADVNLAWPTAQIAVMGAAGAVGFIYRKELKQAHEKGLDVQELAKSFEREYEDHMLNPYKAAERGLIDAVILPSETRSAITRNLRLYADKNVPRPARKHGNIPL